MVRRERSEGKAPSESHLIDCVVCREFVMRLNGVEPSRVFPPTRPSTLRVYQFGHTRARAVDSRCAAGRGRARACSACRRPWEALACEHVFELASRGERWTWT